MALIFNNMYHTKAQNKVKPRQELTNLPLVTMTNFFWILPLFVADGLTQVGLGIEF